jgi:hypothetical protein
MKGLVCLLWIGFALYRTHSTLLTKVEVMLRPTVSLSWCHAPIWGPRLDFNYCQTVSDLLMWGALSDKRTALSFTQLLLALTSVVIHGSVSRGTHDHILLHQILDSSNLEGQVPVFKSPRKWVTQLYPQALGSLFVASYDSQGYGGGIRTRLFSHWSSLYSFGMDHKENTASKIPLLLRVDSLLPNTERLCSFYCSGFQPSCHNIKVCWVVTCLITVDSYPANYCSILFTNIFVISKTCYTCYVYVNVIHQCLFC